MGYTRARPLSSPTLAPLPEPRDHLRGGLHLTLDPASGVPIYLQIIEQVKYQIATRVLRPHDELPSVRALAGQYLINPNTVARAYRGLEHGGLIYKSGAWAPTWPRGG